MFNIFKKISMISLGLLILVFQFFMLINVEAFFPEHTDQYRTIMIVYLLLYGFVFAVQDLRSKLMGIKLGRALQFFAWFVGTIVVLSFVSNFFAGKMLPMNALNSMLSVTFSVILLHSLFVGFVEEFIFRDYIFKKLRSDTKSETFAMFVSAFLFGAFHWVVYQFSFGSMIFAMGIGLTLSYVKKWFDKQDDNMENVGVHSGLNVFVSGVLKQFGVAY